MKAHKFLTGFNEIIFDDLNKKQIFLESNELIIDNIKIEKGVQLDFDLSDFELQLIRGVTITNSSNFCRTCEPLFNGNEDEEVAYIKTILLKRIEDMDKKIELIKANNPLKYLLWSYMFSDMREKALAYLNKQKGGDKG